MMYTNDGVLLSLKEEAGSDPFYSWNELEGEVAALTSLGKSPSQTLEKGWRWGQSFGLEDDGVRKH